MLLNFEKWHGCMNDFVVLWISDVDGDLVLDSIKRQAQGICHRHTGVGADGVLVLRTKNPKDLTPYGLTIINSDGSIAKNCGNGLRCAALSVRKRHEEHGNPKELPEMVNFLVEGENLSCRFAAGRHSQPLVIVDMGSPLLNHQVAWNKDAVASVNKLAGELQINGLSDDMGACEIGNPHIVINTDRASRELMLRVGPALQEGSSWDGMNVHLAKPIVLSSKDQLRATQELGQEVSEGYQVFVWERGAGETMACGSGACAVAALALDTGLLERENWVIVDMPGGRLYVKQESKGDSVLLAGPGQCTFSGRISI
jgi:diaminopimelate epimerase